MKKVHKLSFILLIFIVFASGCAQSDVRENKRPIVYASFYPIYDMVDSVSCDSVDLRCFMPKDKDPHLWEPTLKDMKKLSEADALIVNGANMEKWLDKVEESMPNLKIIKLSDNVELITYKGAASLGDFQYMAQMNLKKDIYSIEFGHTHEDIIRVAFYQNKDDLSQEELIEVGKKIMEKKSSLVQQKETIKIESGEVYGIEMGHESGIVNYEIPEEGNWIFYSDRLSEEILSYELLDLDGEVLQRNHLLEGSTSALDKITYDPHSWLSLVNAKKYVKRVEDELVKLYPSNKGLYRKNRLKTIEELTDLEYEFREKLKELDKREFVVTHHAYAYLARDFDLRQFPLQGLTSMETPSLKTIKKALDFCKYNNIGTVFYELGQEKKGADTIAYELGGQTKPLVSMEYVIRDKENSNKKYIDFMRMNMENIYESLR